MMHLIFFTPLSFLAQASNKVHLTPEERTWRIIVGGIILIGLILVGGVTMLIIRNKIRQNTPDDAGSTGFTLADLRDMRQRGELTEEEFQSARAKLIAKVKGPNAPTDPEPPTPEQ